MLMTSAYCNADDVLLHTVPDSPPGVYLYLGYSRIDAEVLKQGRMKLNDEVTLVFIFSQFAMFLCTFFNTDSSAVPQIFPCRRRLDSELGKDSLDSIKLL
jgi:hypothetical protein